MPQIVEEIPPGLGAEVSAALAWINAERQSAFRVTAIVDPEQALAHRDDPDGFDLSLVLCSGDLCVREQVRVHRDGGAIRCEASGAARAPGEAPALLDPPAGTRSGWLAEKLAQHAFVVLVFYRGFR